MVEERVRGKIVKKPKVVIDYNIGKTSIDLSDQMISYSNPLSRSLKWYRKVALDGLLNIAVVSSFVLLNKVTCSNMSLTNFRTSLVEQLTKNENIVINPSIKHQLQKTGKSRFFMCYSQMSRETSTKYAQSHGLKYRLNVWHVIDIIVHYNINIYLMFYSKKPSI